jgi:uncharacterized protein DUF2877
MRALSLTPFAAELLAGPHRRGIGLGHGYILFGNEVLALTPPGRPRMPNGIESNVVVAEGEAAVVGGGALRTATSAVEGGPVWNPRPLPRVTLSLRPRPQLQLERLAGRGPGLTPLGDDIVIGYIAAAALTGALRPDVASLGVHTARRTTMLSATLLRLAAVGAVPEAAHCLLLDGDPGPLLGFGASSGTGIAFGLALFGVEDGNTSSNERFVPLGGFELVIGTPTSRPPEAVHV